MWHSASCPHACAQAMRVLLCRLLPTSAPAAAVAAAALLQHAALADGLLGISQQHAHTAANCVTHLQQNRGQLCGEYDRRTKRGKVGSACCAAATPGFWWPRSTIPCHAPSCAPPRCLTQRFAGTNGVSRPRPRHGSRRVLVPGAIPVPPPAWSIQPPLAPYNMLQGLLPPRAATDTLSQTCVTAA